MLASALLSTACATPPRDACAPGETRAVSELVYFGTAKPGGPVTPGEWEDFLRVDVTPRFPQGFTVWQASGQWRGADGSIVRESSWMLSLVHPDDNVSETSIAEIRTHYKARFGQEAALRARQIACTSF